MIIILFIWILILYLFLDYIKIRIIKFKPDNSIIWEIAFSEQELFMKLHGRMAEVIMPEKPLIIRLWRRIFSLKGIKMEIK